MENFNRKTVRWFPSESRNNEGKRLVYSNSVKDMVKVLDFVQLGGAGGARTLYLFNAIEALSQLSYSPKRRAGEPA